MRRHAVAPADPQALQLAHFCALVRREVQALVDADSAQRSLRATLAVAHAAASGCTVNLR